MWGFRFTSIERRLEIANKKLFKLDNSSNEIKETIDNLKTKITNKEKYVLKQDEEDKKVNFINKEYNKMQSYQ